MTLLCFCGVLSYLCFNISQVFDHDYTLTALNLATDRSMDTSELPINEDNFDFAIFPLSTIGLTDVMDTYLTVQSFILSKQQDSHDGLIAFTVPVEFEMEYCTEGRLKVSSV